MFRASHPASWVLGKLCLGWIHMVGFCRERQTRTLFSKPQTLPVPSLRYGSCGQRRLPRAVCPRLSSGWASCIQAWSHVYPSLPQPERGGISFSAREEPVRKKVSCLLVWWLVGEGRAVVCLTWICVTVLSQWIVTKMTNVWVGLSCEILEDRDAVQWPLCFPVIPTQGFAYSRHSTLPCRQSGQWITIVFNGSAKTVVLELDVWFDRTS